MKYHGFNTQKAATFESTVSITGALTLTAAMVLGAATVGERRPVTASGGTTRTLTAANSGSINLFDSAAGIAYTLPATAVGLFYDFVTTTTQTSSAHSIVTPASSFLTGGINMMIDTSATTLACAANGTSHTTVSTNGTTTGGIIGTHYRATAVTSTKWALSGVIFGSGSIATPIA